MYPGGSFLPRDQVGMNHPVTEYNRFVYSRAAGKKALDGTGNNSVYIIEYCYRDST